MPNVLRTKKFSMVQMSNMALNLRIKFKRFASLNIDFNSYEHVTPPEADIHYHIYVASLGFFNSKSWAELQDDYFKLMQKY